MREDGEVEYVDTLLETLRCRNMGMLCIWPVCRMSIDRICGALATYSGTVKSLILQHWCDEAVHYFFRSLMASREVMLDCERITIECSTLTLRGVCVPGLSEFISKSTSLCDLNISSFDLDDQAINALVQSKVVDLEFGHFKRGTAQVLNRLLSEGCMKYMTFHTDSFYEPIWRAICNTLRSNRSLFGLRIIETHGPSSPYLRKSRMEEVKKIIDKVVFDAASANTVAASNHTLKFVRYLPPENTYFSTSNCRNQNGFVSRAMAQNQYDLPRNDKIIRKFGIDKDIYDWYQNFMDHLLAPPTPPNEPRDAKKERTKEFLGCYFIIFLAGCQTPDKMFDFLRRGAFLYLKQS